MSEDAPKQPEPIKSEPLSAKPQRAKPESETTFQKVTQSLQQSWVRVQPVLKAQSIKTLRGTIGLLEGVVEKLEAEPIQPPRDISGTVSTPTGELPPAVVIPLQTPVDAGVVTVEVITDGVTDAADLEVQDVTDNVPATKTASPNVTTARPSVATAKPSLLERLRPVGVRFQVLWKATLEKIRSLLPESVNQKLPDWGLTVAVASVVILLIWTTSALLPGKPAPVASVPPANIETPPPVASVPPANIETPPPVASVPPANIETPAELTAPQSPQPVKIEPPPLNLTPEENLIAEIQNQVAEITSQYANGLIQSIQANFRDSLLIVKLSDGWYDLSESQQDKLADEMQERSKELDFSRLQISDSQGTLIARSPVVGDKMVILKRGLLARAPVK